MERQLITRVCQFLFVAVVAPMILLSGASAASLDSVLSAQPSDVRARYTARHPKETLEFFGIKPGMTVIEAFPGGGWYTNILSPYLGPKGQIIGADYAFDMYPKFNFYDAEYLEAKRYWPRDWTQKTISRHGHDGARIGAFQFGSMTADVAGRADAAIFVRALHNLHRYEDDGAYLSTALGEVYRALKPGGIVGVVQHMAPETGSDEWTKGNHGYLKKSVVIAFMKKAGFELVKESDINVNPKDQPQEGEMVWRLPPTYATSADNPALREKLTSIGETTRMTLLFRKPS